MLERVFDKVLDQVGFLKFFLRECGHGLIKVDLLIEII